MSSNCSLRKPVLALLLTVLLVPSAHCANARESALVRKLADYQEIQSVMSRHAWYYSAGQHQRELDELFVRKQPDISFGTNGGYWVGLPSIKRFYVDWFKVQARKDLAQLSKKHPEIKDVESNMLAGTLMMHTMTTPLIVVAGDGKTAKGLFYSPGQVTQTLFGKPSANYMWERYAIDFLKEDGQWRIWHFNVFTDFSVAPGGDWTKPELAEKLVLQPGEIPPWLDPDAPRPDVVAKPYESYGVAVVRGEKPMFPVPYKTFSETFSYGAPKQ